MSLLTFFYRHIVYFLNFILYKSTEKKYCFVYLQMLIFPLSFLGHDAIVTLLKHYKRPQDDSPCNEYSQPGGGMVQGTALFSS